MKKINPKLIILFVLLLSLMILLRGAIIIPILIIISFSLSFLINNFPIRNVGIELATFIGIIIGRIYGPLWGFISCGSLILIHILAGGFFGIYALWVIPTYAIAGALSGFIKGDIVSIGIGLSVFINVVEGIFTSIFSPAFLVKHIPYAITNVIFNVILFTLFGNVVLFFI